MNLPQFSVKNSLFVNLLSVLVLVVGIMAMTNMRREGFPNVAYDIVSVQTTYPGSTPQEVEKLITIPLEDELREVDGIDELTSVSLEGLSMLVIRIDPDSPRKDRVVTDIQRAVDRVQDLPEEADDPFVKEIQTRDRPLATVSCAGQDPWEVRRVAKQLEEWLEDLPGVAKVDKPGWQELQIWVEVDPEKLAALHLSLDEITRALKARNINLPGGKMYVEGEQHLIRTLGEFATPEDIRGVIIRANETGNWLRVGDVASVRYAMEEPERVRRTNGHRAINLVIVKKEREDALKLADRVTSLVKRFEDQLEADVELTVVEDLTLTYVRRRLHILLMNSSIGVFLVIGALLLFLSPRIALLTALGIPIAFALTLAVMAWQGMSINLLAMFGLIIVLGMIVDDAIVVSENSFRYLERGLGAREAALRGTSEVAKPVTATILTTIAAFAPLGFMSGIIGKFVWVIPAVVIVALLASLFESLAILPAHIAEFGGRRRTTTSGPHAAPSKRRVWFMRLRQWYMRVLKRALRFRWITLALIVVVLLGTLVMAKLTMKFVLFPMRRAEVFFARVEASSGTSLEDLEQRLEPIEEAIAKFRPVDVEHFITDIGIHQEERGDPASRRGTNLAQVMVFLTKHGQSRGAETIMAQLRTQIGELPGLEVTFEAVRPGPPIGKPIQVSVRGEEFDILEEIAGKYVRLLSSIDGVRDVRDDYEPGKPELRVLVDEAAAVRAGLQIAPVARTVRAAYEGAKATSIKRTDEEVDVLVRFPAGSRYDPATLESLYVENPQGHLVPLMKIARVDQAPGISFIKHLDHRRTITVTATVDEKIVTSQEVHTQLFEEFAGLSEQYPAYTVRYGGEQEETQESMRGLLQAFLIAAVVIYMILATTFQSLLHPLLVMSAIPFGMIGVIWALRLHGEPLSFMALLGLVGLTGVVVNDSIILVDFINRMRKQGLRPMRAILAGGRTRLRPVILTTVTTLVGLAPVAYGLGGLDPFLRPAALSIVWGLFFATLLTLVFVPCAYAAADDLKQWAQRFLRARRRPAAS